MNKIDVLERLNSGELSIDQVEEIYDSILNSTNASDLYNYLCFSKVESTAFLQGAYFDDLAKWRKEGFPNVCHNCNKKIDIEQFGWMLKESPDNDEEFVIIHLECPDRKSGEIR